MGTPQHWKTRLPDSKDLARSGKEAGAAFPSRLSHFLTVRPLARRASVSSFVIIAAPRSRGWCWLDSNHPGKRGVRGGAAPSERRRASSHGFPAAAPPPRPFRRRPPFLFFTPSSPGAASQQKESLGSNDEDGCVIDSAPLPAALLVEN